MATYPSSKLLKNTENQRKNIIFIKLRLSQVLDVTSESMDYEPFFLARIVVL